MAAEVKGELMAHIDALKYIKFDELTDEQKSELKERLQDRKKELQAAMKAVDRGLATLAKPKRAAKKPK
jgi:hypothetical protein